MMNTELVAAALRGDTLPEKARPMEEELQGEFLTPRRQFNRTWLKKLQPPKQPEPEALASQLAEMPELDPRLQVYFERVGLNGEIEALKLRPVELQQLSSGSALSMTRRMGAKKDSVRGRSGRMPFTPGGLDISERSDTREMHRNHLGLLDTAPGLSRPGRLDEPQNADAIPDLAEESDDDADFGEVDTTSDDESDIEQPLPQSKYDSLDHLLPDTATFMRDLNMEEIKHPTRQNWAHMVDINQKFENFNQLVPDPARTWPFELDSFQKEAVYHLEKGDSVFIAAHTSAGKTVVAEYAMSLAAKHLTKCIYTSPIKALSNQKYRDFKKEYDDVGILTGDVQLNPDASTLIMTTEILRSMLYRGADIIRDVEFIIFDEVHYVNDSERGVVWEEVIIMLPDHVKLVLLSATVPNTFEFANWIGRTKEKDVYVISTPKRPVPLKHYLWAKKNMFEIVDDSQKFNEVGYRKAQEVISPPPPSGGQATRGGAAATRGGRGGGGSGGGRGGNVRGRGGGRGGSSAQQALKRSMPSQPGRFNDGQASKTILLDLTEHLRRNQLLPAVFFVFSRKLCEQYAQNLQSTSLNTGREKSQVYMFMDKAVSRLRKEDRELPQIQMLRELLQQGIGVHHSGLLPIMKEVVEILFARGLVKLLFATETFAMGLNLPTRTVVFTAIKKFDSKTMRFLAPGEYTQMAGRAGRRGLDKVGTVIIMNNNKDEIIPRGPLENIVLGVPTKLTSQFRLTYTMILSLLRIEALKVKDVIQQSFSEDATHVLRPEREKNLVGIQKRAADLTLESQKLIETEQLGGELSNLMSSYHSLASVYHDLTAKIYEAVILFKPSSVVQRFVLYRQSSGKLMLGLIKNVQRSDSRLLVFVVGSLSGRFKSFPHWTAAKPDASSFLLNAVTHNKRYITNLVPVNDIELISAVRIPGFVKSLAVDKANPDELRKPSLVYHENANNVFTEIDLDNVKAVDARTAMKKRDPLLQELRDAANMLEQSLTTNRHDKSAAIIKLYEIIANLSNNEIEAARIRASATAANTALIPDYEQRINVLKDASYVDEQLNVMLKGRVACEISTGYELYMTELLLDNFLGSYEPEEIVALLSAFVFEGARGAEDPQTVTPRLDNGKNRLLDIVQRVQDLATQHQVTVTQDEAEFAEKNRFALMQVVYEWARGMNFSEIMALTTVQEGLIVRVINRLDEVCRSVMSAARIIGDVDLYDKVAIAQGRIKRDIVFCSSLYL